MQHPFSTSSQFDLNKRSSYSQYSPGINPNLKSSMLNTAANEPKPSDKNTEGFSKSPSQTPKGALHFSHSPKNSGTNNNLMTKSFMKKELPVQNPEVVHFMKDIQTKLFKINQTLHDHALQLAERKQLRPHITISKESDLRTDQFQRQISTLIQNQIERELFKPQNILMKELSRLKDQVKQCLHKNDYDVSRKRLENQLTAIKNQAFALKEKSVLDKRTFYDMVKKDIESNYNILTQNTKEVLRKSELQISEMKLQIENINMTKQSNFFISNKKFNDARTFKYKEIFTNQTNDDVVINQVTYYIDNQGYLLDKNHYYLTDLKGFQMKLDQKHMALLRVHGVLQ